MKFLLIFSASIFFLTACNNNSAPVKKDEVKFPKGKFDAIENLIGTSNWRVITDQDTSYLYFSRTGDLHFNVYHYRINKGDSADTRMNNIDNVQDSVIWNFNNEDLLLSEGNNKILVWKKLNEPQDQYILEKTDSVNMSFTFPDGHKAIMKKTLPLSVFLARKRYDYLHGTSYVDSPEVKSRELQVNR